MIIENQHNEDQKYKRLRLALYWIPFLICLSFIAHSSSQTFDEQDLRPEIKRYQAIIELVRRLPEIEFVYSEDTINNRENPIDFIHFFIRKGAHVFSYGLLGLSMLFALGKHGIRGRKSWLYTAIVVFVVASLDELNQAATGGRTGMGKDVLLDFFGFVLFSLIAIATKYALQAIAQRRQL